MKMNTQRIRMAVMLLLGVLLAPLSLQAQDVTVRANNGNCLPAVKNSTSQGTDDTFYGWDGFALWKHNQLNMTMTTADKDANFDVTEYGQFANPANNIFKSSGEALQLGRGRQQDCYVAFTLPKGYRFTEYTIVFRRNINAPTGQTASTGEGANGQASFGEVVKGAAASNWQWLTLQSITLKFTAEADYTPVTPAGTFLNRTAVDIPFSTSCVDLGIIENRLYNGSTRMSYSYESVKDLMANLTLYQEDGGTKAGTHYDGTTGQVINYDGDGGTITSNGDYFQIGAPGTTEKIYYIETPNYVELNDVNKTRNPIGYRIVGSEIKYTYGTSRPARTEHVKESILIDSKSYPMFYISGTVDLYEWLLVFWRHIGNRTYYLTASAGMSTDMLERATWFIDDEGYIRLASDPTKYLKNQTVSGTNNRMAIVSRSDRPGKYAINGSGQITIQGSSSTTMYLSLNVTEETHGLIPRETHPTRVNYFQMINNGTYKATRTLTGREKTFNTYEDREYDLTFPAFTPSDYTLNVYDKTGKKVVKSVTVTSETPDGSLKLDSLNNDAVKIGVVGVGLIEGSLTMQALDPFIDQMTVVCQDQQKPDIRMTQDFYASDFSVNGGEFHFYLPEECAQDGDNVKITFEGLYSHYADESYPKYDVNEKHYSRYNFVKSVHFDAFGESINNIYNDTAEAAHPRLERLKVDQAGSKPFVFNNAAEVGAGGGLLIDYPFTLKDYEGTFDDVILAVTDSVDTATKYVFTTDETAYNIAPTTAIQHRSYAFYTMVINVHSATYNPTAQLKPVYSQTLYGTGQTDPFYGVVVTANDADGHAGFASTKQVMDKIQSVLPNGTTAQQILYVDMSQLAGIYQTNDANTSMADLVKKYAKNCMVFVPKGTAAQVDNVASKTDAAGLFDAARDIVLTDKEPFYSPYNIRVDAARKVSYKRAITKDKYDKVKNASLILPFVVAVDNTGKHTNPDGTSFTLHTMQSSKALALIEGSTYAYFPKLSEVTATKANEPYLVKLTENSTEDNISFVVEQTGSTLSATTGMASNYTFTGAVSTGVAVDASEAQQAGTYTFTPTGSYAGQTIAKTANIFYFADDEFVSSADLTTSGTVKAAPFRAYFASQRTGGNVRLSTFGVIFEEGDGDTDAIHTLRANDLGMSIQAGHGTLTITAAEDSNVQAGETRTISVPAGIYVVNGVKIVVK